VRPTSYGVALPAPGGEAALGARPQAGGL